MKTCRVSCGLVPQEARRARDEALPGFDYMTNVLFCYILGIDYQLRL
jgi:hypothetical protein